LVGVALAAFWSPLSMLIRFSFQEEQYSHIILVPVVSAFLLARERRNIFARVETCWGVGSPLLVAGGVLAWLGHRTFSPLGQNDQLSIAISSLVTLWIGAFVLCYGLRALRAGLFPMLFLLLMVPVPEVVLNRVIFWLQTGSAEVSYALFQLVGVPVFRTDFVFLLPGLSIEISKECSGIRSGIVLLMTSLLAGHLFLRTAWRKAALTLVTLPLLIVKNAIRIVTLTLLSIYVDPSFLMGRLHRDGGILFFLLALVFLTPALRLLQRQEQTGDSLLQVRLKSPL
jgi:exosortase